MRTAQERNITGQSHSLTKVTKLTGAILVLCFDLILKQGPLGSQVGPKLVIFLPQPPTAGITDVYHHSYNENKTHSYLYWHMSITPTLSRQRQEDHSKLSKFGLYSKF